MFLSRMILDPGAHLRDAYWSLCDDAYRMHREAWRLLGGGPDASRDFLYRLEAEGRRPTLYALAPRPARDAEGIWMVESKPFHPKLRRGDCLSFDIRVNPVVTRNGKRHDVVMDAKRSRRNARIAPALSQAELSQVAVSHWFAARGEKYGYGPSQVRVDGYRVREFPRPDGRPPQRIATVEIHGVLEVQDPDRFLELVLTGLGPSKAFGCGLFLLRRV